MMSVNTSLPRRQLHLLRGLLLIALAALGVGLTAPMLSIEQFYLVENRFSLLSGLIQLGREGRWGLCLLIFVFSVLTPVTKLALLLRTLAPGDGGGQRWLNLIHRYGHWAMLDVFVVAVLVAAIKLDAIARVEVHYGLYAFALSVLLTLVITGRVVRLTGHGSR